MAQATLSTAELYYDGPGGNGLEPTLAELAYEYDVGEAAQFYSAMAGLALAFQGQPHSPWLELGRATAEEEKGSELFYGSSV